MGRVLGKESGQGKGIGLGLCIMYGLACLVIWISDLMLNNYQGPIL
jgi:hypothetical protein